MRAGHINPLRLTPTARLTLLTLMRVVAQRRHNGRVGIGAAQERQERKDESVSGPHDGFSEYEVM